MLDSNNFGNLCLIRLELLLHARTKKRGKNWYVVERGENGLF